MARKQEAAGIMDKRWYIHALMWFAISSTTPSLPLSILKGGSFDCQFSKVIYINPITLQSNEKLFSSGGNTGTSFRLRKN